MLIMRRFLSVGLLLLVLSGCQKVELYSELTQQEGNEILATLMERGIPTTKTQVKGLVTITVAQDRVAEAIAVLRAEGLPRDRFADLGDIFEKQGLISSPLEERVRYTYGLSQMLAEAINQIDGVLAARVLIVLPEDSRFGETINPASASVLVKYRPGMGVEESIPKIKMLVQNSVERLDYENISVTIFPAEQDRRLAEQLLESAPTTGGKGVVLPLILGVLLVAALGGNAWLYWRLRR